MLKVGPEMNVTFTRTAERRYRVSVEGPGVVSSWMEPAPGYDARLPHDMAHFVVENELSISGGVFGQLAEGGHARTFHPIAEQASRKLARRGNRIAAANRDDAILSEKVVYLACRAWNNDLSELSPVEGVSAEEIRRVCREFDRVSAVWSKLAVGESMTLVWRGSAGRTGRRRSRHR
jgi:anaerobic selenocysteine-containing dehydrogenase